MQQASRTDGASSEHAALLRRLRSARVSERVASAMMLVPRDRFVPEGMRRYAWEDASLPIGNGQTISQPSLVGRMIDLLHTGPKHRVLDVGTGSGYQAAILSLLVAEVVGVERVHELRVAASALLAELGYENVRVFDAGDELGWPELAPYDAIIVGAAAPDVPDLLVRQLKIGGRLVIPIGSRDQQDVVVIERTGTGTRRETHEPVRFVPLIGEGAWKN